MSRLVPVLLICLAVCTSGCVTLLRGPTDDVSIEADRDSAHVFVDGVPAGVSPVRLPMRRSRNHIVEVVREGFRIGVVEVDRELNQLAVGGAVLGGLPTAFVGTLVDVSTGSLYDLVPGVIYIVLVPDSSGTDAARVTQMVRKAEAAAQTESIVGPVSRWPQPAPPDG